MDVLTVDDDLSIIQLLGNCLAKWGYKGVIARNGEEAWAELQKEGAPSLVILDWMMPGMDGIQVCRKIREAMPDKPIYILLLTSKARQEHIIEGLQAGADDFLSKPFDIEELKARIQTGERIIRFQLEQARRVSQLSEELLQVKKLQGFISICAYCKKIHADKTHWQAVEAYIAKHIGTKFSHTICPSCYQEHVEPELRMLKEQKEKGILKEPEE